MATVLPIQDNPIRPLSVEAYHLLHEKGLVEEKSELIEGVIYAKMTKNPLHSNILRRVFDLATKSTHFTVFKEDPITFGNSEPEPDIAILPQGDYAKSHPTTAFLVIEIANTSLAMDRKKAKIYAQGNIPEYILFNLLENKLELYRNPKDGIYTEIRILAKEEIFISQSVPGLQFNLEQFL